MSRADPSPSRARRRNPVGGLISADIRDWWARTRRTRSSPLRGGDRSDVPPLQRVGGRGRILDESDGTLDRTCGDMTKLLIGKLAYAALLGFTQLTVMFLWGASSSRSSCSATWPDSRDGLVSALASSRWAWRGLRLQDPRSALLSDDAGRAGHVGAGGEHGAAVHHARISAKGRIPDFNAWAIDGFTKIFWREERSPTSAPGAVLLGAAALFFAIARRLARAGRSSRGPEAGPTRHGGGGGIEPSSEVDQKEHYARSRYPAFAIPDANGRGLVPLA